MLRRVTCHDNVFWTDGHRASDWPKEHTWAGKLKISAKGRIAVITLLDSTTNQVFASCTVTDDSCVERTLDSGRYFVLKIQNAQGRHAFIGIAFNERNDAFDFNVALQEHKAECGREDKAAAEPAVSNIPMRDLSIKSGEKITVKIAGAGTVSISRIVIQISSKCVEFIIYKLLASIYFVSLLPHVVGYLLLTSFTSWNNVGIISAM